VGTRSWRAHQWGNKERVQPYEGVVIAKQPRRHDETITVRAIFQGIGVERVFICTAAGGPVQGGGGAVRFCTANFFYCAMGW